MCENIVCALKERADLPLGVQDFTNLRARKRLYVDKTALLQKLAEEGDNYFLARPRRFGKSLTLSTLEAMFEGRRELFYGLACEAWVCENAKHPNPVLHLDMSGMRPYGNAQELNEAIACQLLDIAAVKGLGLSYEKSAEGYLIALLRTLYQQYGSVVVLIDEYDAPILNVIDDDEKARSYREVLRSFYLLLKSSVQMLRFVFLTGISKFSKTGVFSALNTLTDISMSEEYGSLTGYTQEEVEQYFEPFFATALQRLNYTDRTELLSAVKEYYDGYSFDGITKIYNPYSILCFFKNYRLDNYWYTTGLPSSLARYLIKQKAFEPYRYTNYSVFSDFSDTTEIEDASVESFLYQSGYLTIIKREGESLLLDYPNREVQKSLARLYQSLVYKVPDYKKLAENVWQALRDGNLEKLIELYNAELAAIPYDDYRIPKSEGFYRAVFLVMLRSVDVPVYAEVHTHKGRCDCSIELSHTVYIFECKVARDHAEIARKREEGRKQIDEKGYAEPYANDTRSLVCASIVIDAKEHRAYL